MSKIRIEIEEDGKPSATITIPIWLAKTAAALCSRAAGEDLTSRIDFDEVLKAANEPGANGVILEVQDHEDGDRVKITVLP